MKVLIGAPVRQRPDFLLHYLQSLASLDTTGLHVTFCFIDDNDDPRSADMLQEFCRSRANAIVKSAQDQKPSYIRDETTHRWSEELVWRVAKFKDWLISLARSEGYDYLFLVDSDLVLHPLTLQQLLHCRKDIIAEIFWTRWTPSQPELPQVWLFDQYGLYPLQRGKKLPPALVERLTSDFLALLRERGTYRVGGLGACTLISRHALQAGVSFSEIPNLSFWGEDRHFCVRAAALGLELYVDTHLPAYHIYRDEDLVGVEGYRSSFARMAEELSLIRCVRAGLEEWGTRDFRSSTGLEGLAHFTPDLRARLLRGREESVRLLRQRRSVVRTTTGGAVVMSLDASRGTAALRIRVSQEGEELGQPFRDECFAHVSASKVEGRWLISAVEFIPLSPPPDP